MVSGRKRLKQDQLEYFHAVEFAQSTGQFASGWKENEERRKALSGDLMNILKRNVSRRFAHIVANRELNEHMSEETRKLFKVNAYSLCGRSCAGDLRQWMERDRWTTSLELVFEDGDVGKGLLRDTSIRDGFEEPLFRFPVDTTMADGQIIAGLTPLQAADWFSYETFQAAKKNQIARWGMVEFETTPGRVGIYTEADVKALETEMNTPLDQVMKPIPGEHFFV